MINTSDTYKTKVYDSIRRTKGKVEFEIVDVDAAADATASVTSEEEFSKKSQLYNGVRQTSAKYATSENDLLLLDGSFCLPPKTAESGFEVGWVSNALCGATGVFSVAQVCTTYFDADHSSIGLTITFDTLTNEYAEDFDILYYDSSDVALHTENVTGNTLATYILEQNVSDFMKIDVSITKWANPNRRARITEIDFGIIKTYEGDDLVNLNILEEIDTTSNQVTSNEIKMTIDNLDKSFNILNPSGITSYLQRRQRLRPYLGVDITDSYTEHINMGVYYLVDWLSDEGNITTTIVARDMLDILAQSKYRKGKKQSRTLYDLAVDVFTDAGVTNYEVDTALQSIISTGYIPILTHRQALQLIAIAGMAIVYCDRSGKVVIKQLSSTATGETIYLDDMKKSPQVKLDPLVNTVNVKVYNYTARGSSETIYNGSLAINGTVDVWIDYSTIPAQTVSSVVTGGTKNSETSYGSASLLNITAAGTVSIATTGTVLDATTSIYSKVDGSIPESEQPISLDIDNPLITDTIMAANVANWILTEHNKRNIYNINWRQNPAIEAGDILVVEDGFSENKTARITRQEYNFNGALTGKTYAKGGGT